MVEPVFRIRASWSFCSRRASWSSRGKRVSPPHRLQKVIQGPHAVALIGKAGGGGEKDDLGGVVEAASLPGALQTVHPRHHHIQQIEGEPFLPGGLHQLHRALKRLGAQGGVMFPLPFLQQGEKGVQFLFPVVAHRQIHTAAPSLKT